MTDTVDQTAIAQALAVIDAELLRLASRDMVTASEATNVLLDLRLVLAPSLEPVTA